ncbi:MAG: phytanoyl-CoA dioxygenase family protein [Parvibaculum sp.]|uniref:phytanoyl-CoA dioxygenase family protein n=1 Tax=Parvibaculum sp. TaxID=2024848 RepID=UPI002848D7ED|nr:phytanoyl-CoA dioxygenase family protein [Parvibaculum sp.]MDR3500941.1 phytanoyl-CoA dioxygenase family protein [Parvibaculum sp.]
MSEPILHFGVTERTEAACDLDVHAEELRLIGFTVLDSGLAPERVADLRNRIAPVVALQTEEFGGSEAMRQIGDADTARAMLAYDEAFLDLVKNPRLLGLVERMLGGYFILSQQNSIVIHPGETHHQIRFHRDLPYQHFVSSRPLALNALFCADAFTEENGATVVVPGSHKMEPFPSDEAIRRLERPVAAPAGSFIVLDAMTFHRGGQNMTNRPRHGVNHVFVQPFMRQQIDLPALLKGRHADDPVLARLLGYGLETATSVGEWRKRRPRSS